MKENQITQVKEFSAFACMGRCKNLGHWNHSFDIHLTYLDPVVLHLVFPQGSPSVGAAAVENWQCLFTDMAGSIPILSINQMLQSLLYKRKKF